MSKETNPNAARVDVYARVTARILADLEAGCRPWMRPWRADRPLAATTLPLRHNGTPYRGINVLLLWADAAAKGFQSSVWMTYKQAQALGAQVRKGETGSLVVYANRVTKTEINDQGEDIERDIAFLKGYTVFNVDQIDGLAAPAVPSPARPAAELHQAAERFFLGTGAQVRHGGDRAFYAPAVDLIQLPPVEAFRDAESYVATKAHELIHWTGHEGRLARAFGQRFGDQAYAFEELVAELGAAFLCAQLGVTVEPRADHAAYLASWLTVLQGDKRALFTAAGQAQRAVDHLQGLQAFAVAP